MTSRITYTKIVTHGMTRIPHEIAEELRSEVNEMLVQVRI